MGHRRVRRRPAQRARSALPPSYGRLAAAAGRGALVRRRGRRGPVGAEPLRRPRPGHRVRARAAGRRAGGTRPPGARHRRQRGRGHPHPAARGFRPAPLGLRTAAGRRALGHRPAGRRQRRHRRRPSASSAPHDGAARAGRPPRRRDRAAGHRRAGPGPVGRRTRRFYPDRPRPTRSRGPGSAHPHCWDTPAPTGCTPPISGTRTAAPSSRCGAAGASGTPARARNPGTARP